MAYKRDHKYPSQERSTARTLETDTSSRKLRPNESRMTINPKVGRPSQKELGTNGHRRSVFERIFEPKFNQSKPRGRWQTTSFGRDQTWYNRYHWPNQYSGPSVQVRNGPKKKIDLGQEEPRINLVVPSKGKAVAKEEQNKTRICRNGNSPSSPDYEDDSYRQVWIGSEVTFGNMRRLQRLQLARTSWFAS